MFKILEREGDTLHAQCEACGDSCWWTDVPERMVKVIKEGFCGLCRDTGVLPDEVLVSITWEELRILRAIKNM